MLVRVGAVPYYGRKKGTLIDVLSRGHTSVVGRYVEESDMRYVQLANSMMQSDIILLSEGCSEQSLRGKIQWSGSNVKRESE